MGQYYRPVLEDNCGRFSFSSYDYANGAKLMEHSYIGNMLVRRVEIELLNNPMRLTWAGDYADEIEGSEDNLFTATEPKNATEEELSKVKRSLEEDENGDGFKYLVNHTKKEWCSNTGKETKWGGRLSRLPLLTADGNGRGGGDYEGAYMKYVGRWKGDLIEIVNDLSEVDVETYKQIKPNFREK